MKIACIVALGASALFLGSCSDSGPKVVAGTMKFRLGASAATGPAPASLTGTGGPVSLVANDEYIVSPRQAKLHFTSVVFKDATGLTIQESPLTDCNVTYDRTLASGTALLDCPFAAPIGEIAEMQLYFDKAMQLLISDATIGIYSDPSVASGYSTTPPAGGAAFVPYTVTIGDASPSRATDIIFATPVTVDSGTTPSLYVTLDMIHSVQLKVNTGGTTLTNNAGNDPVAVFAGLTPGSSRYYSGAPSIEGYKVLGVPSLRLFYDNAGKPLYAMIGPNFCGADGGPKAAWASPPTTSKTGGWLGKDASNVISFALAANSNWTVYDAYYVMAEQTTIGGSTTLNCKVTASPPPPADGKTYASGAPVLTAPDKGVVMKLIGK